MDTAVVGTNLGSLRCGRPKTSSRGQGLLVPFGYKKHVSIDGHSNLVTYTDNCFFLFASEPN